MMTTGVPDKCFFASVVVWLILFMALASPGAAQTTAQSVKAVLAARTPARAITAFQLQTYLSKRIPRLPNPNNSAQWLREETKLRQHILTDIAFHGWPRE
jgi:hypothetical protein